MSARGTALVTGAGRRIGRAIALDLARHGFQVAVHYRSAPEAAASVANEIRAAGGQALAIAADLAAPDTFDRLLAAGAAALGPVTCLVNNASVFEPDTAATMTPESFDRHIAVNLRAPLLLAQAFARALPPGRDGAIVNIIDQRVWRPTPDFFSYTVAKAGLWAATRTLAQALAPRIRVNAVGPGPVLASIHQSAEEFERERQGTLLGRGASPEEIAAAVRFILDASAMTGQMIALDGGQHLVPPAGTA